MSLKYVLFDLDGTLLPMDQDEFVRYYFGLLVKKAQPYGYEKDSMIKAVWAGTGAMAANDGSRLNCEAFWECFSKALNRNALDDKEMFDDFYANEFQQAQVTTKCNPMAKDIITRLKENGIGTVLATSPIFPKIAIVHRIHWAGLEEDDFEIITHYENMTHSKPNPAYYEDLARELGVEPGDCLMVGNDVDEDMPAAVIGMDVFLLTDCLINKGEKDINQYPHGSFEDLKAYIQRRVQ